MGRWVFLLVIMLLLQLFTYAAAKGLQWWAGNTLSANAGKWLLIGMFVISNVLFAFGISRITEYGIKLSMSWMTLLWLWMMALMVAMVIHGSLLKAAPTLAATPLYQAWGIKALLPATFALLLGMAVYNAYTPVVRHITLTANQPMAKPVRIGMVSDLHLGLFMGNRELNNLTDIVKQQGVALLLMPGDILDDNTVFYEKRNMGAAMQRLVAATPMGVYASLGNHDMYGHEGAIRQVLAQAGVNVLSDQTVAVNDQLWLIGRLDHHATSRKDTRDLMPSVLDKPVILLDHQPNQIEQNVQLPIDLQLSGHTHNGQIIPANLIVKYLNRLGYGHERIGNTDVIVSSGYGFWGVPFRLGSQSEVWVIDLVGRH